MTPDEFGRYPMPTSSSGSGREDLSRPVTVAAEGAHVVSAGPRRESSVRSRRISARHRAIVRGSSARWVRCARKLIEGAPCDAAHPDGIAHRASRRQGHVCRDVSRWAVRHRHRRARRRGFPAVADGAALATRSSLPRASIFPIRARHRRHPLRKCASSASVMSSRRGSIRFRTVRPPCRRSRARPCRTK